MNYTFYILYSGKKDKFYIGFTGDSISERLRKHNSNHDGFTGGTGDWELKHIETYATKQEAMRREKQVKAWKSKRLISKLIENSEGSEHPD